MGISTPKERAVAMLGGFRNAYLSIPTFRPYESIVILLYAKLVVFDRAERLSTPSGCTVMVTQLSSDIVESVASTTNFWNPQGLSLFKSDFEMQFVGIAAPAPAAVAAEADVSHSTGGSPQEAAPGIAFSTASSTRTPITLSWL